MTTSTFTSVLDKPAEDVKPPAQVPFGTFLVLLQGMPVFGKARTGTEQVDFHGKFLQAKEDVNQEQLAAWGGLEGKETKGGMGGLRFYTSEEAGWRLVEFLRDHLGIDPAGKTTRQMIAEAPGKQVYVTWGPEPSQDGKRINSRVQATARV